MTTVDTTMPEISEVDIAAEDPRRFASVLGEEQMTAMRAAIEAARVLLDGRTVWNVNSTAKGGGVAEMLATLLPYACGAGVQTRWMVIGGDDEFFTITKRIHNRLHGAAGDGAGLDDDDRRHYEQVLAGQAEQLKDMMSTGDIAILHDPQTAGMAPLLADAGVSVIWRCHVGLDTPNQEARDTWAFLLPYVRRADRCVFSRRAFAWEGLDEERIRVVAPSIDPFSAKNYEMDHASVHAVLVSAGIIDDGDDTAAAYTRFDGGTARIEHRATIVETSRVDRETLLVVQVSRWDRLKDPLGVLDGFARGVTGACDAHLILAGPSFAEVADDPEGREAYDEVERAWKALGEDVSARIHLACLPMADSEENAAMVNALQRRANVVVQKSLAEGFGLTVAEAMWKSRPVVASRIGGIQDQIEDGTSGILLDDPHDRDAFAAAVCSLLLDSERADRMGSEAHARVQREFLGSRHLAQYVEICAELV
ncbi:MAG TPA: glycosyltransferase [Candidatus Dormibacteraeota bacterium]|nr:glycosyltransferase [Candidatus Dormibacteraeota bacterium]